MGTSTWYTLCANGRRGPARPPCCRNVPSSCVLAQEPWRGWLQGGWAGRGRPEPQSTSRRREATAPLGTSTWYITLCANGRRGPARPPCCRNVPSSCVLAHEPWRGWLQGGWAGQGRLEPQSRRTRPRSFCCFCLWVVPRVVLTRLFTLVV